MPAHRHVWQSRVTGAAPPASPFEPPRLWVCTVDGCRVARPYDYRAPYPPDPGTGEPSRPGWEPT